MSKTTTTNKAVVPVVEGIDPYAVGEDFLKLYQRSFDTAFDNMVKMMESSQNIAEDAWAQVKELQDNGVSTLEKLMKDVKKTQNEYWREMEAGFQQIQLPL
jgi:hypothetical protein